MPARPFAYVADQTFVSGVRLDFAGLVRGHGSLAGEQVQHNSIAG